MHRVYASLVPRLARLWQIIPKKSPIILFFYSQILAYYSFKVAHYSRIILTTEVILI